MSDVLRTAHQVTNSSVTRNCRLQAIGDASCTMVNKPNALATESGGQRASSQSAHTRQQLAISENNDLNTPAAAAAAQAAAGVAGSKQPASPDSVNAGSQPGKAPAQQHAASPASTDPAATAAATTSADQHTASHPHSSPAPTTSADLTEHQQQQGRPQQQQQVPVAAQQPQQPKQQQQQQQQGQEQQQGLEQQQAGPELEALEPLSPPDASEGPEALAEYDAYLQRWKTGDTLAQRWQRLKSKGLLADLQAEWEDWQHDLLLDTIQMQLSTPGGLAAAAAATAAGRQRRGRAEMEAAAANAPAAAAGPGQEPRRVRTRRAPASFQDFHLEGRASGSPDRAGVHLSGAAAADMQRRMLAVQQQLHHGWHGPARAAGPGSNPQQAQAALPARQSNLGRQQLLPPRGMQGPQGRHQQQQQPGAGILSEEFMQKFRATIDMVRSSGSAGGMEGAAALLADPAALHAFVSALSRHTDDPAAAMHRVAATLAAYATQQQPQQ